MINLFFEEGRALASHSVGCSFSVPSGTPSCIRCRNTGQFDLQGDEGATRIDSLLFGLWSRFVDVLVQKEDLVKKTEMGIRSGVCRAFSRQYN